MLGYAERIYLILLALHERAEVYSETWSACFETGCVETVHHSLHDRSHLSLTDRCGLGRCDVKSDILLYGHIGILKATKPLSYYFAILIPYDFNLRVT